VTFPRVELDQQVKQWYNPASVDETLVRTQERRRDRQGAGRPHDLRGEQRFRKLRWLKQGDPDYGREINIVHDAAIKAGVKRCGPWAWKDRPDFT
jgi:hypothetical protein